MAEGRRCRNPEHRLANRPRVRNRPPCRRWSPSGRSLPRSGRAAPGGSQSALRGARHVAVSRARPEGRRQRAGGDRRPDGRHRPAVRIVVLVTAVATAVFLAGEAFFVDLFVQGGGTQAESTAALALASAGVCGISLLAAFVLVARHRESIAAYAFFIGAVITIVAGVAMIAGDPRNESLWMAAALASGQLVGAVVVAHWAAKVMPDLRRMLYLGIASGSALLGGAVLSIATPPTRPFVAAAAALGRAAFSSQSVPRRRTASHG